MAEDWGEMSRNLTYINLRKISVTDKLFGHYIKKIGDKILEHQWDILNDTDGTEPTYCIRNFKIAAGDIKGKREGVVFQDTDLYKWLESVAYSIAGGQAGDFEEKAEEVIDILERAQEEDGYLNTYFQINAPERKWKNLVEGHELYTAGHMMEAAAAYFEATGRDKFLNIAKKNADLICRVFGRNEGQIRGYGGHQEVEIGLIKLYRLTGEKKYLDQAAYFIDERGREPNYLAEEMKRNDFPEFFPEFMRYDLEYAQAAKPAVEQSEAVGHAVRDMYMCSAMADLAEENDDKALRDACLRIWNNMVKRRMYITGGIGSSGFRERFTADYDLPNNTNYCETCASVGLMMFGQRMASLMKNAEYYDAVELALYNTVLAGINTEGDRYFYVNPLEVVPEFCTEHTYMDHVKAERQKWFSVACCPPNLVRTLASLGQYIYAKDEESLYIHEYISSNLEEKIGDTDYKLEMDSDYIRSGKIKIRLSLDGDGKIRLRVPCFSKNTEIKVDDKELDGNVSSGYAEILVSEGEHVIDIKFETAPRWLAANNNVRADSGRMALMKGPVVYCLEEVDNGDHLSEIYVNPNEKVTESKEISPVGELPLLEYEACRIRSTVEEDKLYGEVNFEKEEVKLKAVPYSQWNNRGNGEMSVWQKVKL